MEDIINYIDGQVQISFEKVEGSTFFRDALWMLQAEYEVLSHSDIETMKQTRFDNWLAVINAPPSEVQV
jgi:hypothetical protein